MNRFMYSCGHKYRDTLHNFIFAKVVHNIAFKSHLPKRYASKSKSTLILIPYLLFFIKIIKFYSNNIQGMSVLSKTN